MLEILFVSRPIIFIGYSLRDPDTMLVVRALNERYPGAPGEFCAIMADADDELADFWRRKYNIQLVSYASRSGPAGVDHGALLELLHRLVEAREAADKSRSRRVSGEAPLNSELVRYAARLIKPEAAVQLPVRAVLEQWWVGGRVPPQLRGLIRAELLALLSECPGSFVLEGPAGSGKSFAIGAHLSRVGRRLLEWCLSEFTDGSPPAVPVLLDARLYQGSFVRLAETTVPSTLDLERVSKTHQIVLFLDSLDEMPAQHLESAHWRADLDAFMAEFPRVQVVYGTRRRDLVGDPSLPCYSIEWLDEETVEEALAEVGRGRQSMTKDLFEALRTPFTLMLGRRFLGRQADIGSAPSLLNFFLIEAIDRASKPDYSALVHDRLARLAARIVASGRETVPIEDVVGLFEDTPVVKIAAELAAQRSFVDRLVEAGVLTSEIDDHVRFVHRSVTEFLAAQDLVKRWRCGQSVLADLLDTRRWDNAVAWTAAALVPEEAQRFVREVYESDRTLALRIARAAEVGKTQMLTAVLNALAGDRLSWTDEGGLAYFLEDCQISAEIAPHLRTLLAKGNSLAGVAAGLLVPYFSVAELRDWIDRIGRGEVEYNMLNHFGPALGKGLSGSLLDYFLEVLAATRFAPTYDPEGREDADAVTLRHGFETVIAGLDDAARHTVMRWSLRRSAAVRGIVCAGISKIHAKAEQRYLVQQLERGIDEAIFVLYLALRYSRGEWQGPIPACTVKRFGALIAAVRAGNKERTRWALSLLRCLAEKDDWSTALREEAGSDPDPTLRGVLHVIDPRSDSSIAREFVTRALRNAPKVTVIEQEAIDVLSDSDIVLVEDAVLKAVARHGVAACYLLDSFFTGRRWDGQPVFEVERIEDWIAAIRKAIDSDSRERHWPLPLIHLIRYLAEASTDRALRRVLRSANAPTDPDRDFVLAHIVTRMSTITSDDLTPSTGQRLVELYCREGQEFGTSPGRIATERFVSQVVLPYAETVKGDSRSRRAIEQILEDAGQRHGRRYRPPWSDRGDAVRSRASKLRPAPAAQ
jgi:hypothetical protein